MADTMHEYAVDPVTNETIEVQPPLPESDTPLMGNPVLTRRKAPRRAGSNTTLYAAGAAIAVVVLAGGAYLVASGMHRDNLTTNAPATRQEAAVTPPAAPTSVAPPAAAPALAEPAMTPVAPAAPPPARLASAAPPRHAAIRAAHRVEHREAVRAAAANEDATDTSASVPRRAAPPARLAQPSAPVAATPAAPVTAAPAAPQPAPSPVITPPSP
ncbi:MAG TPA: hypothetical protein VFE13_17750 [Caulobacteraceae bacterium]|jgi:hypothetical protein|nr:hypothetical protein [Caulobacteraceae bacterium]